MLCPSLRRNHWIQLHWTIFILSSTFCFGEDNWGIVWATVSVGPGRSGLWDLFQSGFRDGYRTKITLIGLVDGLDWNASILARLDLSVALCHHSYLRIDSRSCGWKGTHFVIVLLPPVLIAIDPITSMNWSNSFLKVCQHYISLYHHILYWGTGVALHKSNLCANYAYSWNRRSCLRSLTLHDHSAPVYITEMPWRLSDAVQNVGWQTIMGMTQCTQVASLLCELHWLPVDFQVQSGVLVASYSWYIGVTPLLISNCFGPYCNIQQRTEGHILQ